MKAFFNNHLIGYLCTYAITLHLSGKVCCHMGQNRKSIPTLQAFRLVMCCHTSGPLENS